MSKGLTYDSLSHFCRIGGPVEMPGPRPQYAIPLRPEQEARLHQLRACSLAPFATAPRVQLLLLAPRPPRWQDVTIAQRGGGRVNTGKRGRQRRQTPDGLCEAPRAGPRRTCTPRRARGVALAGSAPRQSDRPWQRGSGEELAGVAGGPQIVATLSPGTIRRWLRADRIKPWRDPSWQHASDPRVVGKATPALGLLRPGPDAAGTGSTHGLY